ncbi:MAG TPA: hypothetical protein PLY93_02325 [Turneriella sp.]|nr:hypothetical protein [Turneriella sp.]
MKKNNCAFTNEFILRLESEDWNSQLVSRIQETKRNRAKRRIQWSALCTALLAAALAVTTLFTDDVATDNNFYTSIEEVSGGLQMQVSFIE